MSAGLSEREASAAVSSRQTSASQPFGRRTPNKIPMLFRIREAVSIGGFNDKAAKPPAAMALVESGGARAPFSRGKWRTNGQPLQCGKSCAENPVGTFSPSRVYSPANIPGKDWRRVSYVPATTLPEEHVPDATVFAELVDIIYDCIFYPERWDTGITRHRTKKSVLRPRI